MIKKFIPHWIKKLARKVVPKKPDSGWFGNYPSWEDARKQTGGYDDASIVEKIKKAVLMVKNGEAVAERDSVILEKIEIQEEILEFLRQISRKHKGELHVLDIGGSLGTSYFQYRNLLTDTHTLSWHVVEQKHYVGIGNAEIADERLHFYETIEEANKPAANVLLLSSVLQYIEKPYDLLKICLEFQVEYIIFDRTAFLDADAERITVQIVPEFIYKASYPAWFLNEQKFSGYFTENYELLSTFESEISPRQSLDKKTNAYWKGFVFKRIPKE